MPSNAEFALLAEPFRPELLAHCYRLLGSIHDAEDLVQETYLRGWRAFDRFEGRSSLRRWLYKIATMACLTALESRSRRPLPSGLGAPSDDHRVAVAAHEPSVAWLQPAPDTLFGAGDPAAIVAGRTGVRLAFIAALQLLPARQRAVLTLRDVLAFRTAEVAEILDTTAAAVDSALRRARAHLADAGPVEDDLAEPDEQTRRAVVDGFADAFTRGDADALVDLLRADVELEMPPIATWFTGRPAVVGFLAARVLRSADRWRLVPTRANGQAAFVSYERGGDGQYVAHGVTVLTFTGARIARITAFNDPGLVLTFGLAPRARALNRVAELGAAVRKRQDGGVAGESSFVERAPTTALATLASAVWIQRVGGRPLAQRHEPHGGAEVRCVLGDAPRLLGPLTASTFREIPAGGTVVGVRLRPGVLGGLVGMPADELVDQDVAGAEIWRDTAHLTDVLGDAATPQVALDRLQSFIARSAGEPDPLVGEAVSNLMPWHRGGPALLPELLSISGRQLRRRCRAAVGVGPKELHRILRLQGFVARVQASVADEGPPDVDLAQWAVEAGYHDQAHLGRECRRLLGVTPREYLAQSRITCTCGHDHAASYVPLLRYRGRPFRTRTAAGPGLASGS